MADENNTLWEILTEKGAQYKNKKNAIEIFFPIVDDEEEKDKENNASLIAKNILLGIYHASLSNQNKKTKSFEEYRKRQDLNDVIANYKNTIEDECLLKFDFTKNDKETKDHINAFIIATINSNKEVYEDGNEKAVSYDDVITQLKNNGYDVGGITNNTLTNFYDETKEKAQTSLNTLIVEIFTDLKNNKNEENTNEESEEEISKISYEQLKGYSGFDDFANSFLKLDYLDNGTNARSLSRTADEVADYLIEFINTKLQENDEADQESLANAFSVIYGMVGNKSIEPKTYDMPKQEMIENTEIGRFNTEENFNTLYSDLFPEENKE